MQKNRNIINLHSFTIKTTFFKNSRCENGKMKPQLGQPKVLKAYDEQDTIYIS